MSKLIESYPTATSSQVRIRSLSIETPQCELGIGSVITSPNSDELIEGVRIDPIAVWPDDRGQFMEVLRVGTGLAADFPPETSQVSATVTYPRHRQSVSLPSATVRLLDRRKRHPPDRARGHAAGFPDFWSAQHAVCRKLTQLADLDSARRGARVKSHRHRRSRARLRHKPLLRSIR